MNTKTNGLGDAIFEYYTNPYSDRALLIDGDWGEGKTYFLTEILPGILASKQIDSWHLLSDTPPSIEIRHVSLFGGKFQR